MSTHKDVNIDERTLAVGHAANTWGFNFISLALLVDIMFRALVWKEAAWFPITPKARILFALF